jgi:hypothetical protein
MQGEPGKHVINAAAATKPSRHGIKRYAASKQSRQQWIRLPGMLALNHACCHLHLTLLLGRVFGTCIFAGRGSVQFLF